MKQYVWICACVSIVGPKQLKASMIDGGLLFIVGFLSQLLLPERLEWFIQRPNSF